METARRLKLTPSDVNGLYSQFSRLDESNNGLIDIIEFIVMNRISCEIFGNILVIFIRFHSKVLVQVKWFST